MDDLKSFELFVKKNNKKNIFSALSLIHGISNRCLDRILVVSGLDRHQRVKSITLNNFETLKEQVTFFYNLEENKIFNNVEKKKQLKSYVGMRHLLRLPVHGQRTHSNADTAKRNIKKEI